MLALTTGSHSRRRGGEVQF